MERSRILAIMQQVLAKQGNPASLNEALDLQEVRFRSLDFSEVALRIEQEIGRELNFEVSNLRHIRSVGDALDFFEIAAK